MEPTKIDHKMWKRIAKRKTNAEISWPPKDLRMVLSLHKDKPLNDPAMLRWLAEVILIDGKVERDALLTEVGKRS